MQLTREIEVGMDVDGDGVSDLNADRIYYSGQSFGGIYGTMFIAVEPSIKAGVPNVPHASVATGKTPEDNVEVRRCGHPREFNFPPKAHWDLGPELGIQRAVPQ